MLPNDEIHERKQTILELQQWRLGPLPYTMQPPEIVERPLEWSWTGVPKQGSNNGHFWFFAGVGLPTFNEISLLTGKVFTTREVMQEE